MKCRRLKIYEDETGQHTELVWFGSYGKNQDGSSKFYSDVNKHDNFADKQEGVKDSLIQRLSIIRRELWYNTLYGLPIANKEKSKLTIDAEISKIVMSHPDVVRIITFNSNIINKKYNCYMEILSTFGELTLNI